ncbi:hypothetical protein PPACK8108_LOCUS3827 [Phakopsora pachyrhizi]|uniref:Myb/SANT-like domain-containing protein n=1 Tax=Phakopsora pachyrhizi TaxID=170000 RepID=A0AAV0AKS2_PHAPC|nr:hypothetical protein PPACK8108_LOCUS3827 [Phakopsora pachyrhizi]
MPRAKSSQATVNNSLGHLTNDDHAIICAWLSKPSKYSSCFGKPGSTTVGQPPASKENGFNLMVNELNKKTKSGLHLTSKQMKEQFKTYQSQYGKAKKESSSTGFGLTEEDQSKGFITISQKLNLMCPCYEQMDHIFGSLPNVNPIGGGDPEQNTWSLPQTTNESTDEDMLPNLGEAAPTPVNEEQLFRFLKEDEDTREGEDQNQPALNSDIITNDIISSEDIQICPSPTTYAELNEAKTDPNNQSPMARSGLTADEYMIKDALKAQAESAAHRLLELSEDDGNLFSGLMERFLTKDEVYPLVKNDVLKQIAPPTIDRASQVRKDYAIEFKNSPSLAKKLKSETSLTEKEEEEEICSIVKRFIELNRDLLPSNLTNQERMGQMEESAIVVVVALLGDFWRLLEPFKAIDKADLSLSLSTRLWVWPTVDRDDIGLREKEAEKILDKESELRMKQEEVKKELEYKRLEYAKEEEDKDLIYAREEKEKDRKLKLLLAEKEKEALKRKEDHEMLLAVVGSSRSLAEISEIAKILNID